MATTHTINLITAIAQTWQAYENCIRSKNTEWESKHSQRLDELEKQLPSGSGIDCGTHIDRSRCSAERIELACSFHHMNEHGYYTHWTEHRIIVTPAFSSINIRITGKNDNDIKDYLHDTFLHCLTSPAELY